MMIIDTPEGIQAYRLLALKSMLSLEVKGMKHSRVSAYALVKKEFGLTGNKANVLNKYIDLLKEKGILL